MPDFHTLIPCEVSPGQFTGEMAVTLHLLGGRVITLFADGKLIEKHNGKTYLKVTTIQTTTSAKTTTRAKKQSELVVLPTEAFESGSRWLRKTGNELAIP